MDSEEEGIYDDVDSGNESSGDDVDFAMEVDSNQTRERQSDMEEYPFEVLSTEEIVQHMVDCIREVNMVVEIPATTIRILLNHFKWDKEKLMERLYDGDQDQLFSDAHVINPYHTPPVIPRTRPRKTTANGTEECEICFTVLPSSMMTGLECGHRFCTQCWGEYLTTKIMEEGLGQTIACAAHGCDILVDDATVMRLVRDAKVKLKYQHLITNSFVECNKLLKWCPKATCNNAVKVEYSQCRRVVCQCGYAFCFSCGEDVHDPVDCQMLKQWRKKCGDDSETTNWITTNTKECPKCKVNIEKIGGCNHMRCRNENCKHQFCWNCLNPWDVHMEDNIVCTRYVEDPERTKHLSHSLRALQRYLHYHNRYLNHWQSLKFEKKLQTSMDLKMRELQQQNVSYIDLKFLNAAVETLCQCRQTLMYSYPFAYYLEKNGQAQIFEANQRDLEQATEILSENLEGEITLENLNDLKEIVLNKHSYCCTRRKVLLKHVQEGHDQSLWDFIE